VLNPLFETRALERERKVILEEIKMYHDNPTSYVFEKIKDLLYKPPFNLSIAGTLKTVAGLTREQVVGLHDSIYGANNMIFSVVGKTSWDAVMEEARKFPSTKKSISHIPIGTHHGTSIEKRKGIDQAHEVLGFHMPVLGDRRRYAAEVFDSILGGGMSSRLFQELREKRGLCYSVKSNLEQSRDYAYEMIYVGTTKDKIQESRKIILREIQKLRTLNQRDLSDAKERLIGLREISKEKCDATMMDLIQEELGGNAEKYYAYEFHVGAVKLADVRALSSLKGYSFAALVPA
jgi:predicted Zn-dependent peptidase